MGKEAPSSNEKAERAYNFEIPHEDNQKPFRYILFSSRVCWSGGCKVIAPRPEQVAPDRKKKEKGSEKHKPTLGKLLGDDGYR